MTQKRYRRQNVSYGVTYPATRNSAIRRIGHERWLRNIAVALGNAPKSDTIIEALKTKLPHPSELVREHVKWALDQQFGKALPKGIPV